MLAARLDDDDDDEHEFKMIIILRSLALLPTSTLISLACVS